TLAPPTLEARAPRRSGEEPPPPPHSPPRGGTPASSHYRRCRTTARRTPGPVRDWHGESHGELGDGRRAASRGRDRSGACPATTGRCRGRRRSALAAGDRAQVAVGRRRRDAKRVGAQARRFRNCGRSRTVTQRTRTAFFCVANVLANG